MKNPAKPGDFGTNGTRGVVELGMSETTKRWSAPLEDPPSLFDRRAWEEATNEQRARWLDGMRNAAPRPSTLAAEGGVERETTNSPAEIGVGCTGRKIDPSPWFTIPLLLVSMVGFGCEIGGVPEIGLACFGLFAAFCGIGAASGFFSVVRGVEGA